MTEYSWRSVMSKTYNFCECFQALWHDTYEPCCMIENGLKNDGVSGSVEKNQPAMALRRKRWTKYDSGFKAKSEERIIYHLPNVFRLNFVKLHLYQMIDHCLESRFLFLVCLTWQVRYLPLKNFPGENNNFWRRYSFLTRYFKIEGFSKINFYGKYISYMINFFLVEFTSDGYFFL